MFRGDVVEACTSARAGTDAVAGGEGAFAAEGPARRAAEGRGCSGCAGNAASSRTGTLAGTETIGVDSRSGTALWGNGAATVFIN